MKIRAKLLSLSLSADVKLFLRAILFLPRTPIRLHRIFHIQARENVNGSGGYSSRPFSPRLLFFFFFFALRRSKREKPAATAAAAIRKLLALSLSLTLLILGIFLAFSSASRSKSNVNYVLASELAFLTREKKKEEL